jgi:inosine-uridine nucleoside N-ribohydrolase
MIEHCLFSLQDPAAMGVVWNSSVPLTLVPLDATNKVGCINQMIH